jgi:hypothetical protein
MTQTNREIADSARFFSSLLEVDSVSNETFLQWLDVLRESP